MTLHLFLSGDYSSAKLHPIFTALPHHPILSRLSTTNDSFKAPFLWFIDLKGGTLAPWPSGLVQHYKNYITQAFSWQLPLLHFIYCISPESYPGCASGSMLIVAAVPRDVTAKPVTWWGCRAGDQSWVVQFSQVRDFRTAQNGVKVKQAGWEAGEHHWLSLHSSVACKHEPKRVQGRNTVEWNSMPGKKFACFCTKSSAAGLI